MYSGDKPQIPLGLGYALAENTGALKYFAEISSERQREIIDRSTEMRSRAELRNYVRSMAGMSSITM